MPPALLWLIGGAIWFGVTLLGAVVLGRGVKLADKDAAQRSGHVVLHLVQSS